MPTNDFLPIGTAGGANVEAQAAYVADPVRLPFYADDSIPDAKVHGKMLRQASAVISQFAQMICDYSGLDMLDDANLATLLANMKTQFRIRMTAATTFYVRSDGNNAHSGLANNAAGAFLTLQGAFDALTKLWDANNFQVTILVGVNGTYAGGQLNGRLVGQGSNYVLIGGNPGATSAVIFNTEINVAFGGYVAFQNMKLAGGGNGIISSGSGSGVVTLVGMEFGAVIGGTSAHIYCAGGACSINNDYAISGGGGSHMVSFGGGGGFSINGGITITITGTPNFAVGFAQLSIGGSINVGAPPATYAGGATGARFVLDMLAFVYSFGAVSSTYFPGNIAGTLVPGHGAVYN